MSGKRHYLRATIPADTPNADRQARATLTRLVGQVEERPHPRTNATVAQLLERYLDQLGRAPNTVRLYRRHTRLHILPFLGKVRVGAVDAETLDPLYAELRRCHTHCDGRRRRPSHDARPCL